MEIWQYTFLTQEIISSELRTADNFETENIDIFQEFLKWNIGTLKTLLTKEVTLDIQNWKSGKGNNGGKNAAIFTFLVTVSRHNGHSRNLNSIWRNFFILTVQTSQQKWWQGRYSKIFLQFLNISIHTGQESSMPALEGLESQAFVLISMAIWLFMIFLDVFRLQPDCWLDWPIEIDARTRFWSWNDHVLYWPVASCVISTWWSLPAPWLPNPLPPIGISCQWQNCFWQIATYKNQIMSST